MSLKVSREALESYSAALSAITDEAVRAFEARCKAVIGSYDLETLDDEGKRSLRDEVADAFLEMVETYSGATASTSLSALEYIADAQGRHLDATMEAVDETKTLRSVKAYATHLFGSDPDYGRFVEDCARALRRNVYHAGDRRVARNAVDFGMKFARVPQGPTCVFCLMLASRGFVYATEETAGEMTKYHDDCDCRIVAGYDGMEVEGYDPDSLYRQYLSCRDTVTHGDPLSTPIREKWDSMTPDAQARYRDFSDYETKVILAEMRTRDRRWLYDGTEPAPVYVKPRSEMRIHEQRAVELLSANGFRVVVAEEDGSKSANIDILLRYGEKGSKLVEWEMKNVGDGKHSIEDAFKDAASKWKRLGNESPVRVVLTSVNGTRTDAEILEEAKRRMRYIDELLFINNDGKAFRIEKK